MLLLALTEQNKVVLFSHDQACEAIGAESSNKFKIQYIYVWVLKKKKFEVKSALFFCVGQL